MRKIRFKGYNPAYGWLYGDLLEDDTKRIPFAAIITDAGDVLKVDSETVGQLTGLTDCHDVDLYEGDTLYAPRIGRRYVVRWSDGSFVARYTYPDGTYSDQDLYGLLFDHQVVNRGRLMGVVTDGRTTDPRREPTAAKTDQGHEPAGF